MAGPERFYSPERTNKWLLREILEFNDEENQWMDLSLPFSDISSEWISDESIYAEALSALPLGRLSSIKALSFLSYRYESPTDEKIHITYPFNHDRFDHSLVVAMTSERMAQRNGLTENDTQKLVLAGLLHDIATPALGDATKTLDQQNLHEETHWQEVIGEKGHELLKKYRVSPDEMSSIIRNEGLLGEILDVADRITYVMKDLHQVADALYKILPSVHYSELAYLLSQNKGLGNIYRDVMVDDNQKHLYFNDPGRLFSFLELRGLLHFSLYHSPYTSGRDRLISRFLAPFYTPDTETEEKPLTPQKLRKMDDSELMSFLCNAYGRSSQLQNFFYADLSGFNPQFERYETQKEAEERMVEIQNSTEVIPLGIVPHRGFNPGTNYLVKTDGNRILPFSEADPKRARILEEMSTATKGIFVFYSDLSEEGSVNTLLREVFQPQEKK